MAEPLPVLPRRDPPHAAADQPHLRLVSPSIVQGEEHKTAYEIKYLVSAETVAFIHRWAGEHMQLDPHACPTGECGYLTTTLYLDTPALDVFHRGTGYKRKKYRIRRYGDASEAFVECKVRHGDATSKQRCNIPLEEVARLSSCEPGSGWAAEGFRSEIAKRGLLPICRISYFRSAWMCPSPAGPMRLTIDRQIRGVPSDNWELIPVDEGRQILEQQFVCELKFKETMPALFKSLLEQSPLSGAAVSKYRRWMQASLGIAPGSVNGAGPNGAGPHG